MRNVNKKREIRSARDLIRIRLIFRRKKLYKYKVIPNEIKNKNVMIILEKASARITELFLKKKFKYPQGVQKIFQK